MNFDDLIAGGEGAINDLIGRQETLQLEFKANDSREPIFIDGALTKSGRKILAKEASAFANSAGGVIVFGVDCRAVDGIDQAERLTPIAAIDRAETTVRDAASELLQPRHDGIKVAAVRCEGDASTGFIVMDVPRSERRPHRSEAADQKQYFKRSGSRSYPMEHYDIEDAFRRSSSPSLTLEIAIRRTMSIGRDEARYHLALAIKNSGEVTAKSVTMQLWERRGDVFGADNFSPRKNETSTFHDRLYVAAPLDFVIHPGETREFHHFALSIIKRNGEIKLGSQSLSEAVVCFKYTLGAENMRVEEREMELLDLVVEAARLFVQFG